MIGQIKPFLVRLVKNRVLQHILFWVLSFLILLNVLKVSADVRTIDRIYTAIFHIPVLILVYFNLQVLFPVFLEKRRFVFYILSVLSAISTGSLFYLVLFNYLIDYLFPGYYFIAYYDFWDISLFFSIYLLVSSLLHLARGWFRLQEIEKERKEAELKSLYAQINPHFLFNSLNSIYSLSRKNSPLVPGKIIQLSDLMRHIIYECNADFILLEKEIEMVYNYIDLQNLRTQETEKIEMQVHGEIKGKKIAPFIFLPFVENSFKHGLKSGAENAYVKITLEINKNQLRFEIRNSKGNTSGFKDTKYRGIGIENVRKRLNLIYPGNHTLDITETENTFCVVLQINM